VTASYEHAALVPCGRADVGRKAGAGTFSISVPDVIRSTQLPRSGAPDPDRRTPFRETSPVVGFVGAHTQEMEQATVTGMPAALWQRCTAVPRPASVAPDPAGLPLARASGATTLRLERLHRHARCSRCRAIRLSERSFQCSPFDQSALADAAISSLSIAAIYFLNLFSLLASP